MEEGLGTHNVHDSYSRQVFSARRSCFRMIRILSRLSRKRYSCRGLTWANDIESWITKVVLQQLEHFGFETKHFYMSIWFFRTCGVFLHNNLSSSIVYLIALVSQKQIWQSGSRGCWSAGGHHHIWYDIATAGSIDEDAGEVKIH